MPKTISTVVARAGMACRRRDVSMPASAIAPITAARSTLAVGCTTNTNATSATPARTTAALGPITRAQNSTAPHTIVTLAPDTAIRCVRPAVRKSAPFWSLTADVSPSTRAGSIAACSAGSVPQAAAAKRPRSRWAACCTAPAVPTVG